MSTPMVRHVARLPSIRTWQLSGPARCGVSQRALLQTSAARWAGKESALGHEGRADEVDMHKHDQLKKQKEGRGHWKDELASDSESIVKADRGEIDASEDTIKQLQRETSEMAKKTHKASGDESKTG